MSVCLVFGAAEPMACSAVASSDRIPDGPVVPVGDVASAGVCVVVVAAAVVTVGAVVAVSAAKEVGVAAGFSGSAAGALGRRRLFRGCGRAAAVAGLVAAVAFGASASACFEAAGVLLRTPRMAAVGLRSEDRTRGSLGLRTRVVGRR